jgi:hypothetical protein
MDKVFSADGTVIAYEQQGWGPAVVLVGGAFMTRGDSAELAGMLAKCPHRSPCRPCCRRDGHLPRHRAQVDAPLAG